MVSTNAAENWKIGNSYDSTGGFCYPEKGLIPVLSKDFLILQLKKFGKIVSDYEEPNNINFYLLRRDNLILRLPLLSWGFFLAFGLAGFLFHGAGDGNFFLFTVTWCSMVYPLWHFLLPAVSGCRSGRC